tara:strand:- start:29494 stop:29745 length:252 start_codon:yes stop_codon:yes gene_type:complete
MQDLIKSVKKIIQSQLSISLDKIVPEANLIDDLEADSLDSVELMMAFEETFNIEIEDEVAEKINTVQDLIDLVYSYSNKASFS